MLPMVHTEPVFFNFGGPNIDGAAAPSASVPPPLTPQSDVDELVDIFFDVDVAVETFPRIDSCDLQLGDTWRGMQGKMSVTAPVKKIRKKSDNKPQSQINKCNNEKRRRELENETINQLEELLGTCLAEVKQPDKNGIVREATRQIQEVLQRRRECPSECPQRARRSPVQAGEVSSTQPSPALYYSETTTLIEALKHYTNTLGWVLLEINSKGEIVCITENIKDFILLDRTDLYQKSIFSLLHVRDHAKIRPLLRNIQNFGWSAGDAEKFQAIQARLAIEHSNGTDTTQYVEAVIHAAPVRGSPAEQAGSVMCVIRRCEDASAALIPAPLPLDPGPPAPATRTDQIVFRLDCNFNILSCDCSGLEHLAGARYLELVESGERVRIAAHLKSAQPFPAPPTVSEPFRLRLADKPVRVLAQTRLFCAEATSGEHDFIMSTHVLLDEEEQGAPAPRAPLLPALPNGDAAFRAAMSPDLSLNDFDLDPWAGGFSMSGEISGDESKDTKDTCSDGPPTPRTPATPGDPQPPAHADERLRSLLTKPSTAADPANNSNNRLLKVLLKQEDEEATSSEISAPHTPHTPNTPHTPHTPHTPAAALSPLHTAPGHTRPPPPLPSHNSHNPHGSHQSHPLQPTSMHSVQPVHHNSSDILSRILHNNSDEDVEDIRRNCQDSGPRPSQQSALLTQLLANGPSNNGRAQDSERDHYYSQQQQANKRKFEESKGSSSNNAKRTTPEIQQVSSSAAGPATPTCSSASSPASSGAGMSPLCAKNQILVSLLARQQTSPTTPLPLPNPSLRAYPPAARPRAPPPHASHASHASHAPHAPHASHAQQPPRHLSAVTNMLAAHSRASSVNGNSGEGGPALQAQSHLQLMLTGGARGAYPPPAPPAPEPLHYAHPAPHLLYNTPPQSNPRPQSAQNAQGATGDGEVPSLSDILDEVIESMPDDRSAPDPVMMDLETCQLKTDFTNMKENAMINAIRQSLMQYEAATGKSPASTSPGPGPGPPPVYSAHNLGPMNMGGGTGALYSSGGAGSDAARARVAVQERERLLGLQRNQQMLVSREAAEQAQPDLGSTISALVSGTAPNVALQRAPDYHHYMHPNNQMGSNYGTNKITSTQQNPMLSRQLSGSGGGTGYAHGAHSPHGMTTHAPAALHTPLTQRAPYLRAPRPHLVGVYYDEAGASAGYCGEYAHARRTPHAPHAPHGPHATHASHTPHQNHPSPHDQVLSCTGNGGGAGAGTSEYVRNELRAVVGARSTRPELHAPLNPDLDPLMTFDMAAPPGGSSVVGGRAAPAAAGSWEPQQSTPSTTEAGTAAAGPAGGDETAPGARAGAGAAAKASLLQKLLSQ